MRLGRSSELPEGSISVALTTGILVSVGFAFFYAKFSTLLGGLHAANAALYLGAYPVLLLQARSGGSNARLLRRCNYVDVDRQLRVWWHAIADDSVIYFACDRFIIDHWPPGWLVLDRASKPFGNAATDGSGKIKERCPTRWAVG